MWMLWAGLAAFAEAGAVVVSLLDGSPAEGARAVSLKKTHFAHVVGDTFARPLEDELFLVSADGKLEVTDATAGRWIILHAQGWADAGLTQSSPPLLLNPWNQVPGTLVVPHEPDAMISFARTELPRSSTETGGIVYWTCRVDVNDEGSFLLTQLPNGPGVVGLFREVKTEQRISRWRDYPQAVEIPRKSPILLGGGGVSVRGNISGIDVPASITLLPGESGPVYHSVTGPDGGFHVPGVLPGAYQLTARPLLVHGKDPPPVITFSVENQDVNLGIVSPLERGFQLEVDRRVEMPDELVGRILDAAKRQHPGAIEKIWIGQLSHPGGDFGARVTFEPAVQAADPTSAIEPMLILPIPGESVRKFYPEYDFFGFGFRFGNSEIAPGELLESPVRVFPLIERAWFFPLQDGVDYQTALALLRDIEADAIQRIQSTREKMPDGSWRISHQGVSGSITPSVLSTITNIRKGKGGNDFEIQTRDRPFGGRNYYFKKTADGFLLTGVGSWVS
jgi:hypothetical protein